MTLFFAYLLFLVISAALVLAVLAWYSAGVARRIEAALPPQGRFVDVDGVRLHLRDEGSGPPLLLVHGLQGQMGNFNFGAMAELSRSHRVIAVDRPGAGYSSSAPGMGADLASQARILARLIEELGLERPTVVGHSLGGAVALALALDHPHAVGALALVAPLSHPAQDVPPVFRALAIRSRPVLRLVAWTLAVPATVIGGRKVVAQVFAPEPVPPDFGTRGGGLLSMRPRQFLAAAADMQALEGHLAALAARYRLLDVPLAVLVGRGDGILDWRANGQALVDQVPGARLELVDGGHMLPVTRPDVTARFIVEASGARRLAA